jgi:hypothetical protein
LYKEGRNMASNDQIILEQILQQQKASMENNITDSELFEIFTVENALKGFELVDEQIESGIVDGSNDGGIDSIYTFINGELLRFDTDIAAFNKRNIKIELFIIQSKTSAGFSGEAIEKLVTVTNDLLDLSIDLEDMTSHYNTRLLEAVGMFRNAYSMLSQRYRPKLFISYIYASFGDAQHVHPDVLWKQGKLKSAVMSLFSDCAYQFQFFGAAELLQQYRKKASGNLPLHLLENATSTTFSNAQGYLCLVSLEKYYDFITDEDGDLRQSIFDANIRDYQGKVEVNEGIKSTLSGEASEDFWWLNNGITIIATSGTIVGKTITLEDAQIVNGLQTSTEIFNYFKNGFLRDDKRSILVRVIVIDDLASRDKIIKATNSQTAIPAASLHATDAVQRNIEDDFLTKGGLFYDRRKNYYKNLGYPRDKILSISYLAQAVMAIVFREPDSSRGKPSSLLKDDKEYARIFSDKYSIHLYWTCAKIMKLVDSYTKSAQAGLPAEAKNNLVFYVAMYAALVKLGRANYKPNDVVGIDLNSLDSSFLSDCVVQVVIVFDGLRSDTGRQMDVLAKKRESTNALLKHFENSMKAK